MIIKSCFQPYIICKTTYNHVRKICIGKIIITVQNETEAKKDETLYIRNDRDDTDIADFNTEKCKNILDESIKDYHKAIIKKLVRKMKLTKIIDL